MRTVKCGQVRQGDVLLHPIERLPEGAVRVKVSGRIVLAEGEATGHAHVIEQTDDVELYERDGVLYLRVLAVVPVLHEEHADPGMDRRLYEVRRQVETWMDEVRVVSD